MGIVGGLARRQLSGEGSSPHSASLEQMRPEIERLFQMARDGLIPRDRELKPWEPATLNERHLMMISARAGGLRQREIARAMDATDANVSVVLNHPDAVFILNKLQAMKAVSGTSIEDRLAALAEPAVEALEELMGDTEISPLKKAPSAFAILKSQGYIKEKVSHEHDHAHTFRAAPEQMDRLTQAIHQSRSIPALQTYEIQDAREIPAGPPSIPVDEAPSGAGAAPSSDESQGS